MDAVTHVLLGAAFGMWVARRLGRSRTQWACVAGAAALAPDLDVFLSPLGRIDALYWLSHRSASHSLFVAPLAGWGFVRLLGRLSTRWHRLKLFATSPQDWIPILIGAWSHVPLDLVTHKGVPLWWPISDAFVSLELFYWIVPWLALVSIVPLVLRYRGRWNDRRLMQSAVVVLAIIVILAGARLTARPAIDDAEIYPTPVPWVWLAATPHDNGTWSIVTTGGSDDGDTAWYDGTQAPGSGPPLAQLHDSLAWRAYRFQQVGPLVTTAEAVPDGWWLNTTAILQEHSLRDAPAFLPVDRLREQARLVAFVEGPRVTIIG